MDIASNFVFGSDSFFDVVERSRKGSSLLNLSFASEFMVVPVSLLDIKGWNFLHPDRPITDPYQNIIRFVINNRPYYCSIFDLSYSAYSFVLDLLGVDAEEG